MKFRKKKCFKMAAKTFLSHHKKKKKKKKMLIYANKHKK